MMVPTRRVKVEPSLIVDNHGRVTEIITSHEEKKLRGRGDCIQSKKEVTNHDEGEAVNEEDDSNEKWDEVIVGYDEEDDGLASVRVVIQEGDESELRMNPNIYTDLREVDLKIWKFWKEHKCSQQCLEKFTIDEMRQFRNESEALDYTEDGVNRLNVLILGIIRVLWYKRDIKKHSGKNIHETRIHGRCDYRVLGERVCREFFLFAHAIGIRRWKLLLRTFKNKGLIEKRHGNCTKGADGRFVTNIGVRPTKKNSTRIKSKKKNIVGVFHNYSE